MLGYNCQYARANVKRKEVAKLEESYRNEKSYAVGIVGIEKCLVQTRHLDYFSFVELTPNNLFCRSRLDGCD